MSIQVIPIFLVVFLGSVILHEIAHGYVAWRYGDDTARLAGRLSLNPLVHIDPIGSILVPLLLIVSQAGFLFGWAKPVPVNPYRLQGGKKAYRLVTLAGIGTNVVLAIIAGGVLSLATNAMELPYSNLGVVFFALAFYLNIILGVFNAIPLPGFDGFNFLTTFDGFGQAISRTPLGNPMFMAQYGLMLSLLLLFLASSWIGQVIFYLLVTAAGFFNIIAPLSGVLDLI